MASSSSSDIGDNLDALTCSVCLQIYKEPVTLPCGHSFCRLCIEKHWESREEDCVCPNCREVFPQKPKLKKTVAFAYIVENIVNVKKGGTGGTGGTESHCEVCNREAAKRCVPCEILCCEQHLKPHQQKWHKLVDPGVKIEELRCNEHRKPILLYCKDDGSLMCVTCTGGEHQDHKIVGVEIAYAELKVLQKRLNRSQQNFGWVILGTPGVKTFDLDALPFFSCCLYAFLCRRVSHLGSGQNSSRDAEDSLEEKRMLVCQFVNESVDLMKSEIKKRKMEKLSLLGKQREKLEQQMENLREGKSTMDTAFQELEAVSFLQGSTDLLKRLETMSDFKSVKRTPLPVLDFSKEEKYSDGLITLSKNLLEKIQKGLVEHPEKVDLDQKNLRNLYGRTLTLDPNSANRWIKISRSLRTATRTWTENPYPKHLDRFDVWKHVVSSESFSSGRHYWEVFVSSSRRCDIGICLNAMGRKGFGSGSGLGMNPESWCLEKHYNKYSAHHNDEKTTLSVQGDPERFGFFLDCEAGELTCFGDSRVLHVFRGNFMDPVKPAFGVYDFDGDSVHFVK
uniref:E3 ubiquitin/ISG15 ligase TRIM25-like n=1 Tax=Myxine glutinosa TaxID=7769 RepID=UPI00358E4882